MRGNGKNGFDGKPDMGILSSMPCQRRPVHGPAAPVLSYETGFQTAKPGPPVGYH